MRKMESEEGILEDLERRGTDRPIPEYETAGDPCANPECDKPVPENSNKTLNLGLPDYCSLGCRLEVEDDD